MSNAISKNLKSVKVLLANAEAIIINELQKTDSDELRNIYRTITSVQSKIDNIDKVSKE